MADADLRPAEPNLTPTSYVVLGIVAWVGRPTPYEITKRIEQSVANFWPVPRSQVYAETARLARETLLDEAQEPGGRRRKRYALTAGGRRALERWLADPDTREPELRDPGLLKVFLGGDPAAIAAERVAYHRAKLDEFEGYRGLMAGSTSDAGPIRAVEAGIEYERVSLEFWSRWGSVR